MSRNEATMPMLGPQRLRIRNAQGVVMAFQQYDIKRYISRQLNAINWYEKWSPGAPWRLVFMGSVYFVTKSNATVVAIFLTKALSKTGFMYHGPPRRMKNDNLEVSSSQ